MNPTTHKSQTSNRFLSTPVNALEALLRAVSYTDPATMRATSAGPKYDDRETKGQMTKKRKIGINSHMILSELWFKMVNWWMRETSHL